MYVICDVQPLGRRKQELACYLSRQRHAAHTIQYILRVEDGH